MRPTSEPWERVDPGPACLRTARREQLGAGAAWAGALRLAATSAWVAATPAAAASAPPEPWKAEFALGADTKLRIELYERIRGEFVDFFGDPIVDGQVIPREADYSFVGNKFQLGVRLKGEPFETFAQFQNSTLAALPANSIVPGRVFEGVGAVYYANTPHTTQNGAFLRQGWLKLKHDGFYVSGGRQLYSDAAQGAARHKSLKWIQDYRWAQRLIGPWDYTHVGRSFDGGLLGYLSDNIEVSGFAFMPTFGGFEINGQPTITDINVAGATVNLRDSEAVGQTLGQLAYYYYSDTRGLVAADNRSAAVRAAAKGQPIEIHTLGANAAHLLPLGPGVADGSFYSYGQFGDWQNLNHGAWAYGVEVGYQLPDVWGSPWLRAGINSGSGDANPNDRDHQTFFQMLPTAWLYAQYPFYNMMNNQDVFLQALVKPHPMVNLRADFHWLTVNETRDVVYSGSGATSDTLFGYSGTPTGGFDDLAYLASFVLNVKPVDHLAFNIFYGHAFGQNIINANYVGKQGAYGFVEAIVSF